MPRHYIRGNDDVVIEGDYVLRVQQVGADGTEVISPGAIPVGQGQALLYAPISATGSGNTSVVAAAGAGNRIYLVSYVVVVTTAVSVKWRSADTDLSGAMPFADNGGASVLGEASSPLLRTAANEALNINLSGAVATGGHCSYFVAA